MLPYLEHSNFFSARRALILISISIALFSKLEITSDEFVLLGVTVKTGGISFELLSLLLLGYLAGNFVFRAWLHIFISYEEAEEQFRRTATMANTFDKEPISKSAIIEYLYGDLSTFDESMQQNILAFRKSRDVGLAKIKKNYSLTILWMLDIFPAVVVALFAYYTLFGTPV